MQSYMIFYRKRNEIRYTYITARSKKHAKDIFISKGFDDNDIIEMKTLSRVFKYL